MFCFNSDFFYLFIYTLGRYQSWKRFEALFDETSVGQAIKSIKIESRTNPFYLHYKYLENFVRIQIPQFQDQLYKVIISDYAVILTFTM